MIDQEKLRRQKEYRKKWNQEHPEKVREYKRNSAIRRVVNAIKAGDVVLVERTALEERFED